MNNFLVFKYSFMRLSGAFCLVSNHLRNLVTFELTVFVVDDPNRKLFSPLNLSAC